jgi:chemotaxis protein MotB
MAQHQKHHKNKTSEFIVDDHIEEDSEGVWLISYADLMTLLFTLFLVLYATAMGGGSHSMQESIAQAFGAEMKPAHEGLKKAIEELAEKSGIGHEMKMELNMDSLEISFTSTVLFASGSAELTNSLVEPFQKLVKIIKDKAPDHLIRVEGHTDSRPIQTLSFPSNWELSSARAATIIKLFEIESFPRKHLTAIGFSDARPKEGPEVDGLSEEEKMSLNRRVVIKVTIPPNVVKKLIEE